MFIWSLESRSNEISYRVDNSQLGPEVGHLWEVGTNGNRM